VLAPVVAELRNIHPDLRIDMVSGDRLIDLIAEGVDVAIRLGELEDSSYRAVRIGICAKWLVASPAFVRHNLLPADLRQATSLPFVGLSVLPQPARCRLECTDGRTYELNFVTDFRPIRFIPAAQRLQKVPALHCCRIFLYALTLQVDDWFASTKTGQLHPCQFMHCYHRASTRRQK
jgi:hypothetical protein